MANAPYVEHSTQEKTRLLGEVRESAITLAMSRTARDRRYSGLSREERAARYIQSILTTTPAEKEDRQLIEFIKGKARKLTGYDISVLMAALGCNIQDLFPSVKPSLGERTPQGAESFRGIGSYWDALQFVIN